MDVKREWFERDYYDVLGVPADASEKEVQRAYRSLARELHPDANPGDEVAENRFKQVSAAYDVIGDAETRKAYDQVRRSQNGGFEGSEYGFDIGDIGDLGDLLGDVFGKKGFDGFGPFGSPSGPRHSSRPTRGRDLEAHLRLSFHDAITGTTTGVSLTREDGPSRTIKVRVPAGVNDGQRIRLRGQGGRGLNGAPDGDLYVNVGVSEDRVFGRNGKDLTVELPLTFAEAALGATVSVPTLDGEAVRLKIPESTPHGKVFRVKGEGITVKGATGDLLVTVLLDMPAELNRKQRRALQAYDEATEDSPRRHLRKHGVE